ncbi:hypothetical protein ACFYN0_27120 [Streptomyces sp. NPDC006704]|uniref:hypothetical protein n=1 Tax=Streptomyces sp. NPDC006704 TaxID=3364760 RepID=UPI0036B30EDE
MRRRSIAITTALFACATTALTACSGSGSGSASGAGSAKSPATAKTPAASPVPATPAAEKGPYADLTGGQIVVNALKATRQATSLHMKADFTDSAKDGSSTMDVSMDTKGDCTGTMGQGKDTIKITKVGKFAYMKTKDTGAKWVKADTTTADGKELATACDLDNFLKSFEQDDTDGKHDTSKKGGTTTVDGHPAISITDRDGKEHYTVNVATTGKPYILKVVVTGGDNPGTMEFSHFDEPIQAVAPPKSSVIPSR